MINYREILRRLLKYIVIVLISGSSMYVIPKNKLRNKDIIYISLIIGMVFCILDIITPSIQIIIKEDEEHGTVHSEEHVNVHSEEHVNVHSEEHVNVHSEEQ